MKIGEVSKRYNISEDTLRYYERVGVLPSVRLFFRRKAAFCGFFLFLHCPGLFGVL